MNRPHPSASLRELSELFDFGIRLTPAPEIWEWLQAEILADIGNIHNEDHDHLLVNSGGRCAAGECGTDSYLTSRAAWI